MTKLFNAPSALAVAALGACVSVSPASAAMVPAAEATLGPVVLEAVPLADGERREARKEKREARRERRVERREDADRERDPERVERRESRRAEREKRRGERRESR